MTAKKAYLLSVNGGSSSLKFGLFDTEGLAAEALGQVSGIGKEEGRLSVKAGGETHEAIGFYPDSITAMQAIIHWLEKYPVVAIGHRLVQGGPQHLAPEIIDEGLISALEQLIHLAPNHLPASLELIRICRKAFPGVVQAACYDTWFHRGMPGYARHFAIPRPLWEEGVIRYGFHGLSYEYIMQALEDPAFSARKDRIIIAHLGNGSSICAVSGGRSIDTTMGLTPSGGLVMGTRTGDLDPGVLLYLLRQKGMDAEALEKLINKESGLEALSGNGHDVKTLLDRETEDVHAAEAIAVFCYQAKKFIGALAAALGGLDLLVFTGGIGENAPAIRARILDGLGFMGMTLDDGKNAAGSGIVSAADSRVGIAVIRTNEEMMIARHVAGLIR